AKGDSWIVKVPRVPLQAGKDEPTKNRVTVQLANAEALSDASEVEVVAVPPKSPAPLVHLPTTKQITLEDPEYNLKFQVTSRKPLQRLEVTNGTKVVFAPAAEQLAKMKTNEQGNYEFETGDLALDWAPNKLTVQAWNDGGPNLKDASLIVSV